MSESKSNSKEIHFFSFSLSLKFQPENIMLLNRNTQNIKLIDFGLSRRIQPGQEVRDMMGTAEFVGKMWIDR